MLETLPRLPKASEPTRPLSLRIPESLLAALQEAAERGDRSLNAQVVRVFREWAERQDKQAKD